MECKILYLDSIVHATRFKQRKVYAKYREKKCKCYQLKSPNNNIFFLLFMRIFLVGTTFFLLQTHVIIAVGTDPNYVLISYVF